MTSLTGFCIELWRERACAFKYDSDEICLSLFSHMHVRAGEEQACSFSAPAHVYARHQSAVCVMTWMCVGVFCWLSLCVCVCVRYLSLALSLFLSTRACQILSAVCGWWKSSVAAALFEVVMVSKSQS